MWGSILASPMGQQKMLSDPPLIPVLRAHGQASYVPVAHQTSQGKRGNDRGVPSAGSARPSKQGLERSKAVKQQPAGPWRLPALPQSGREGENK